MTKYIPFIFVKCCSHSDNIQPNSVEVLNNFIDTCQTYVHIKLLMKQQTNKKGKHNNTNNAFIINAKFT